MHYELFLCVPAPLRSAVGLSAISLLAKPGSGSGNGTRNWEWNQISLPSPNLVPDLLAKDAAPIPNAWGATNSKSLTQNNNS